MSSRSLAVDGQWHRVEVDNAVIVAEGDGVAMCRLYGGIHYPVDNEVGLDMGREIGRMVVDRAEADGSSG